MNQGGENVNTKQIIPFVVWLITKMDQSAWTTMKSEVDKAFAQENKRDVIPAGKQDDISKRIIERL